MKETRHNRTKRNDKWKETHESLEIEYKIIAIKMLN